MDQQTVPTSLGNFKSETTLEDALGNLSLKRKFTSYRQREGGLSSVSIDNILQYIPKLKKVKENSSIHKDLLPSVEAFKNVIYSDPILRMNWEQGINQSPIKLEGHSGLQIIDMIDSAVKLGLPFNHSELIGCPIRCIFIEFMQTENGRTFFSNEKVNKTLKQFLNELGKTLDSEASLTYMNDKSSEGWFFEDAKKEIDYNLYICDPTKPYYGFKNWNQWFIRQFKVGARAIGAGSPNGVQEQNIIVNSCQSTPLAAPLQPSINVKLTDYFWLKDDKYSLTDMFGAYSLGKQHLAKHFQGGTVYQAFLSPLNYHRWHSPIDGVIQDIYGIEGTYFLDQSQFIQYDSGSPNNSQSFLSTVAARKIFVINSTNPLIGKIAIIYIGMVQILSISEWFRYQLVSKQQESEIKWVKVNSWDTLLLVDLHMLQFLRRKLSLNLRQVCIGSPRMEAKFLSNNICMHFWHKQYRIELNDAYFLKRNIFYSYKVSFEQITISYCLQQ